MGISSLECVGSGVVQMADTSGQNQIRSQHHVEKTSQRKQSARTKSSKKVGI